MHEIGGKLQGLLGSQRKHGKSPLERVSVFYSKLLDFPIPPILLKLPEIHVLPPILPREIRSQTSVGRSHRTVKYS
jgi:hypothetical protein